MTTTQRGNAIGSVEQLTITAVILVGLTSVLQAQPIAVPNSSFESQPAPNAYPFVNVFVDSWEKSPEPDYYAANIGTPFGIPWFGTVGVFLDVNPYANHIGNQVGYILGFPQVTLSQDYNSSPTHDFNATFDVGRAYNLTIGVFGKSTLAPGSTLQLSLYYLSGLDKITVGSTTISYDSALFPITPSLSLVDFSVNVPTVQASYAWAGQHIGIQLESTSPITLATGGNWDFDNVRLDVVPEPGTVALLNLGIGGLLLARRCARR